MIENFRNIPLKSFGLIDMAPPSIIPSCDITYSLLSLLLRYGPSASGDAESLGYIIMNSIASLPWLDPKFFEAEQTTAERKILAAVGSVSISIFCEHYIHLSSGVGSYCK